jgi:hypothetical protein
MDFIERWLHVSPDGGDGTLEIAYLVVSMALILAIGFRHSLRRAFSRGVDWAGRR